MNKNKYKNITAMLPTTGGLAEDLVGAQVFLAGSWWADGDDIHIRCGEGEITVNRTVLIRGLPALSQWLEINPPSKQKEI